MKPAKSTDHKRRSKTRELLNCSMIGSSCLLRLLPLPMPIPCTAICVFAAFNGVLLERRRAPFCCRCPHPHQPRTPAESRRTTSIGFVNTRHVVVVALPLLLLPVPPAAASCLLGFACVVEYIALYLGGVGGAGGCWVRLRQGSTRRRNQTHRPVINGV